MGIVKKPLKFVVECKKLGVLADAFAFPLVIRVYTLMGSRKLCRSVHEHVVEMGFQWNLHVGNELMGMYGKIGRMDSVHKMFDRTAVRSCVSWNTMILGYALSYDCHGASEMFQMMGFY